MKNDQKFYINEGFKEIYFGPHNTDDCSPPKSTGCYDRKEGRAITYLTYPRTRKLSISFSLSLSPYSSAISIPTLTQVLLKGLGCSHVQCPTFEETCIDNALPLSIIQFFTKSKKYMPRP